MSAEPREWPLRLGGAWLDVGWGVFAACNLVATLLVPDWETVPFHFIWVSLTILYGFRVWRGGPTLLVLGTVMATTGVTLYIDYRRGAQPPDELTEIPLMAAMFAAMVWHARRRVVAMRQIEQVSEANRRLLERQRLFVQDASHELRTPITVALGHAELVLRCTAGALREDARVVVEELLRLRRLSDRLLLLATVGDPEFLRKTKVEIEPILVETLRRWATVPRRWRLGMVVEAEVEADADRLALAIDALVENAVKHTTESQPIELSAHRRQGMVAVCVADGGTGVRAEDLSRLFDRFVRGPAGDREGLGLGLAIVKAVAEAHGGTVQVWSRDGGGSRFELLLPIADAPARGSGPAVAAACWPDSAPASP
ncbi:MAG TPA: HAMP domain-containing sensor histidine kinase [Candidatus Dormibacteraeota bacterium]|nr:HAMP domain-containing sensor histidine kinase [Candidatus Dormibacteraeota bacterium]